MFMPLAMLMRTMPLVGFAPIIYIIFGDGALCVAIIGLIIVFFPVLINMTAGLRSAPAQSIDVVSVYGGGRWTAVRMVALPTALPNFFAALKIAVPGSLVGAMLYEWLFSLKGLGGEINVAMPMPCTARPGPSSCSSPGFRFCSTTSSSSSKRRCSPAGDPTRDVTSSRHSEGRTVMPTPHIAAQPSEFAEDVLMPGDPLRARRIADEVLEDAKLVTDVRGILGYTGRYRGSALSVLASGMGMPSITIYATELAREYGVKRMVRVGTRWAFAERGTARRGDRDRRAHDSAMTAARIPGLSFSHVPSFPLLRKRWRSRRTGRGRGCARRKPCSPRTISI